MAAGDVDNDGDNDLVSANDGGNTISVLLNNGNGTFAPAIPTPVLNGPRDPKLADLDGDNDLDIVVANFNSNTISVLLNNGTGAFGAPVT